MSWLTDLAGKAENLLNKIDQNAAVVLKDKNLINEQLQDVIWKNPGTEKSHDLEISAANPQAKHILSLSQIPRSAPSGAASPARRPSLSQSDTSYLKRDDDYDLLHFLNAAEPVQCASEELRGSPSGASVPSAGSSSPVNLVDISCGDQIRSDSQGGMHSMASSYMSSGHDEQIYHQCFKPLENEDSYSQGSELAQLPVADILAENNLLKNEIRSLNGELTLLLQRCRSAEKEASGSAQELISLKQMLSQTENVENQLQNLRSKLEEKEKALSILSAENKRLIDNQAGLVSQESDVTRKLSKKLKQLESENQNLIQESNDLCFQVSRLQTTVNDTVQQNDRYRQQILEVSSEAEQYRARATRVLQEKEKLIASLQSTEHTEDQSSGSMAEQEMKQLREELQILRQESVSHSLVLSSVRNELQVCEIQREEQRQKAEIQIDTLQKKLQEERSRRVAAEEDSRAHFEELQSAKKEASLQIEYLLESQRTKEAEILRLKQQLQSSNNVSKSNSGTAELEGRVRNLATSLIQKQGALEALIAERNSLTLKLERMEKMSALISHSPSTNGIALSINENENGARMRVPTLLSENPSDTGVTRRVKRAYSSLDTLGIRVGTFLRRYPLARILVILYMVLLHLWVAVVLFSYSPEGQTSDTIKIPPAHTPEEPRRI